LDDEASTSLINITTGLVASKAVEISMCKIPDMGKEMLEKFTTERLVEKTSSFWDPIPKMPVVTFSAMKKCLSTDKDRRKLLIDTEVLFRRLLAVSKNRDVDMRNVLAYELAAVPPSMFRDDGKMRKTTKADLAKTLEEQYDEQPVLPQVSLVSSQPAAYLIDGMSMLHSLNDNHFKTLNDLGKVVLKRLVRILNNKDMEPPVDVVMIRNIPSNPVSASHEERQIRNQRQQRCTQLQTISQV